ncbi:MAG TPA: spore germination protein [Symbiobacteriaceae bacterium]|nr:spore germination protein [Symbiobacteriaceae bacterium]
MARPVSSDLTVNVDFIKEQMGSSLDLVHRSFVCGADDRQQGALFCLDTSVDGVQVATVLRGLLELTNPPFDFPKAGSDLIERLSMTVIQAEEVETVTDLDQALNAMLKGQTVVFLEGSATALLVDTRKPPTRAVEEPSTEAETRGPRDGFTEDLMINLALIRRRLRDPRLRAENLVIGRRSRTDVALVYIKDVVRPGLVEEVRRRIERIDIDAVPGSGYIEELIMDNPRSPFGFLNTTERPDKLIGNLLEGRVGIVVDNTPFALIVPTVFWHWLQAPGDYYQNYMVATAYRMLRIFALLTSLIAPSLYTILASFHHEMIPTPLALSMAAGREGTPLPTLIEVLALTIMFEVMHEAGLRLPRAVGQTVSIVGALVIGEAAVMAGLVSPATVIVVSAAGLAAFAIPFYGASQAIRLIRIPLLILSGAFGVFGFVAGTTALAMHAASLRNLGQPFLSPLAPLHVADLKDTALRAPWWAMALRPHVARNAPSRRQRESTGAPSPPDRRRS